MTVAAGLQAAMLLAQGRKEGLAYIGEGLDGAARSFWAAAICLPALVALRLLAWTGAGVPAAPGHAMAIDVLFYVVGWAGFALLSRPALARMGRAGAWPRYIATWNWCNVAQYLLMVAAALPVLLDAPDWVGEAAWIVAVLWSLWLEWFAARLVLAVAPLAAASLVALDLLIGLVLNGVADALAPLGVPLGG